ncbi:hypothetical protein AGOR_G00184420 [Albula goreensis]|uniref:Uncharacterized protein n=1 Tax=Albula goreensis TaxID=1534307 RepID=A0A8T3CXJ1_9TELE|nr:hypothetical protein AGOR_G00184420 [Albula goreensis]
MMTRKVTLKLLVLMLAASLSENKETCSSQHGKVQDGLGCFEETSSHYVDPERRSQTDPKSQSSGKSLNHCEPMDSAYSSAVLNDKSSYKYCLGTHPQ